MVWSTTPVDAQSLMNVPEDEFVDSVNNALVFISIFSFYHVTVNCLLGRVILKCSFLQLLKYKLSENESVTRLVMQALAKSNCCEKSIFLSAGMR